MDSLRKQVSMPGEEENGSHHGREKKIYSNFQAAGSGGMSFPPSLGQFLT